MIGRSSACEWFRVRRVRVRVRVRGRVGVRGSQSSACVRVGCRSSVPSPRHQLLYDGPGLEIDDPWVAT